MATKSAGRVSIRVLPDSSQFRRDLKLSLERIEKTMKAEIPAHLVVTRESIQRLREQIRELSLRVKIDPYVTEEQMHELKKKVERVTPHLKANLDALNAQRRLAFISRDRQVNLFVKVNTASLAAAATALAALSGLRLVGSGFQNFFNRFAELDRVAPKIALISSLILGLVSSVGSLVSNFGGLIGSIAQLGQIAVLFPAVFFGAAIAVGVAIAAFKDMKKVLKDLAPAMHKLQDDISADFWREAAKPIREFVNQTLKIINTLDGSSTATSLGKFFGQLANSLKKNLTPDLLSAMFHNLNRAIDILAKGIEPLIHAFTVLGTFGTKQLPRLAEWLTKLSGKFDAFITNADKTGKLQEWADEGIKAFQDLGDVLFQTGRVFSALNQSAKRAGGADFEQLAGGLKKLSDVMRTEGFQKGFETMFAGMHKAMDGFFDGFNRLGPGLAKFAPAFNAILTTVGKIFGQLGENIGLLLGDPTLQDGLKRFFSGFLTFLTDLKPAMKPLGEIFGTLGDVAATLLSQFGPLITNVLTKAAPLFADIWKTIKPLIPDLIRLADSIIDKLGPPLTKFVETVLPKLIPLIAALVPLVAALVAAVTPAVADFFEKLGKALEKYGPDFIAAVTWLADFTGAVTGLVTAFSQISLGDPFGGIKSIIQFAIDHPEAVVFFNLLNGALGGLFDKLEAVGKAATGVLAFLALLQVASNTGLPVALFAIGVLLENVRVAWEIFVESLRIRWQNFWNGLPAPLQGALIALGVIFSGGWAGFLIIVATQLAIMKIQWDTFWAGLPLRVATALFLAAAQLPLGFASIIAGIQVGLATALVEFIRGWQLMIDSIPGIFDAMVRGVGLGIIIVVGAIKGLPGQMIANLMSSYDDFVNAGAALIRGFAAGIVSAIATAAVPAIIQAVTTISSYIPKSPAKKGPFSGRGWTPHRGAALVEGFAEGMKSRTGLLQKQANATMSAAQLNGAAFSTASARSGGTVEYVGSTGKALVNIEGDYYGATPEKVAAEFETKTRRANLVAQLGKVGK